MWQDRVSALIALSPRSKEGGQNSSLRLFHSHLIHIHAIHHSPLSLSSQLNSLDFKTKHNSSMKNGIVFQCIILFKFTQHTL